MTEDRTDFTVANAVDGKLGPADLRMDPAVLAHQAVVAEAGGILSMLIAPTTPIGSLK